MQAAMAVVVVVVVGAVRGIVMQGCYKEVALVKLLTSGELLEVVVVVVVPPPPPPPPPPNLIPLLAFSRCLFTLH
ncbi:hypothetical protein E2C01_100312 [Portunus trituberculatus]|uniref:Secreted protein n=1 Tax=Portunus trituberculatus TaxID=210409 RepID=A0A5B7KJ59_PORTR|nr:hypothetical protein [Portunus trituberculatus]